MSKVWQQKEDKYIETLQKMVEKTDKFKMQTNSLLSRREKQLLYNFREKNCSSAVINANWRFFSH